MGRRDDGRARGAGRLDRVVVLRRRRGAPTAGPTTAGSRPGDIVTIEPNGYIEIQDRAKDLVKSGGEWISTVALENALMGHPAVAEAAVIAIPDEKWSERPLAVVVLREGAAATPDELREFLAPDFAKWWLPDRFEFVDELPKTAVGKFRKTALREQFAKPAPAETESEWQFISTEQDGAVAVVTIDHPPVNALSAPLLEELEAELDRLDADPDTSRDRPPRRGREGVRRGRRHLRVPVAARGGCRAQRGRVGAGDPEARRADGRRRHALRRRDPRLVSRRRARAGDGLRHPGRVRGRAARPAGDQARADSRRRRDAAAAAPRRRWPGAAPEHRRASRRRGKPRTSGASSRRSCPRDGAARRRARDRPHLRGTVAASRSPSSASSRGRRATSRWRRASAARPRRSAAAWRVRGRPARASQRSSRSASRSSRVGEAAVRHRGSTGGPRAARPSRGCRPEPEAGEEPDRRRASRRRRRQLRGRPDPAGPVPADARAALRAGQEVAGRLDGRRVVGFVRDSRRRVRRAGRRRRRWLFDLPGPRRRSRKAPRSCSPS